MNDISKEYLVCVVRKAGGDTDIYLIDSPMAASQIQAELTDGYIAELWTAPLNGQATLLRVMYPQPHLLKR